MRQDGDGLISKFYKSISIAPSGCWIWIGRRYRVGYGQFNWSDQRWDYAHRFAYQTFNGSLVDGLEIDHMCNNKSCVNPNHLEQVTHAENMRRAYAYKAATSDRCRRGKHKLPPYVRGESRKCSMCRKESDVARRLGKSRSLAASDVIPSAAPACNTSLKVVRPMSFVLREKANMNTIAGDYDILLSEPSEFDLLDAVRALKKPLRLSKHADRVIQLLVFDDLSLDSAARSARLSRNSIRRIMSKTTSALARFIGDGGSLTASLIRFRMNGSHVPTKGLTP